MPLKRNDYIWSCAVSLYHKNSNIFKFRAISPKGKDGDKSSDEKTNDE